MPWPYALIAALEEPELLADDVRSFFRSPRDGWSGAD
jgi:hypothetical protein